LANLLGGETNRDLGLTTFEGLIRLAARRGAALHGALRGDQVPYPTFSPSACMLLGLLPSGPSWTRTYLRWRCSWRRCCSCPRFDTCACATSGTTCCRLERCVHRGGLTTRRGGCWCTGCCLTCRGRRDRARAPSWRAPMRPRRPPSIPRSKLPYRILKIRECESLLNTARAVDLSRAFGRRRRRGRAFSSGASRAVSDWRGGKPAGRPIFSRSLFDAVDPADQGCAKRDQRAIAGTFTVWISAEHIGLPAFSPSLPSDHPCTHRTARTPSRRRVPTYALWARPCSLFSTCWRRMLIGLKLRPIWSGSTTPCDYTNCLVAAASARYRLSVTRIAGIAFYCTTLRLCGASESDFRTAPPFSGHVWFPGAVSGGKKKNRHACGGRCAAGGFSVARSHVADGVCLGSARAGFKASLAGRCSRLCG